MASANDSDVRDRRGDNSSDEDDVAVLEQSPGLVADDFDDTPLRGTPEELIETLTNRYKFLAPKFFTLTKITKSTSAKKRADIGLQFVCRNCPNTTVSAGVSSSSNLRRHIKSSHPSLLKKFEEAWEEHKKQQKEKNLKRKPVGSEGNKRDEDDTESKKLKLQQPKLFTRPNQEQIDRNIVKFIVETNQVISI